MVLARSVFSCFTCLTRIPEITQGTIDERLVGAVITGVKRERPEDQGNAEAAMATTVVHQVLPALGQVAQSVSAMHMLVPHLERVVERVVQTAVRQELTVVRQELTFVQQKLLLKLLRRRMRRPKTAGVRQGEILYGCFRWAAVCAPI